MKNKCFKKNKNLEIIKEWWSIYKTPLAIFTSSRIIIFFVLWLMLAYSFEGATLNHWDAPHYISIAEDGYQFYGEYKDKGALIAFFPFYPLLINLFHQIFNTSFPSSAYLISFIAGLFSALLLFKGLV